MSNKIFIGIDPDVDKSGYALWILEKKEIKVESTFKISKLKFFEILENLQKMKTMEKVGFKVKIIIEAGWLNQRSNWHTDGMGEFVAGRVGSKVGANHQVGKFLAEMCEYLGLEYELSQPKTSKFKIKQFRMMTGYKGELDQDMVDAGLLVYNRV